MSAKPATRKYKRRAPGRYFVVLALMVSQFAGGVEPDLSGSVRWVSSQGDSLSQQAQFATELSVGTHVLTASVTVAEDLTVLDTTTVTVVPASNVRIEALTASEDAFSHSAARNWKTGDLDYIRLRCGHRERVGFVNFDLSDIQDAVLGAVLKVYVRNLNSPGTLEVYRVAEAWDEATLTYNTQPATGTNPVSREIENQGDYVSVDVSAIVRAWQGAPDEVFGFALVPAESLDLRMGTRTFEKPPILELKTTDLDRSSPAVTILSPQNGSMLLAGQPQEFAASALNGNGDDLSGSLNWNSSASEPLESGSGFFAVLEPGIHVLTSSVTVDNVITAIDSSVVTIVPAEQARKTELHASEDAFTHEGAKNWNPSDRDYLRVRPQPLERIGYVNFNLSTLQGTPLLATLRLYVGELIHGGTLQVHAVRGPWAESNIRHRNQPPLSAAVANRQIEGQHEYVEFDVTAIIREWQAEPTSAPGFALVAADSLDLRFHSRENTHPPRLELTTASTSDVAPGIRIVSPTVGAVFIEGEPVPFLVSANDLHNNRETVQVPVNEAAGGSTTLAWTPPAINEDGSPLLDLAGYRLRWGKEYGTYTHTRTIADPVITSALIDGLERGYYKFVITSFNESGIESRPSKAVIKMIQ